MGNLNKKDVIQNSRPNQSFCFVKVCPGLTAIIHKVAAHFSLEPKTVLKMFVNTRVLKAEF